jgi:hypothetical protein
VITAQDIAERGLILRGTVASTAHGATSSSGDDVALVRQNETPQQA